MELYTFIGGVILGILLGLLISLVLLTWAVPETKDCTFEQIINKLKDSFG